MNMFRLTSALPLATLGLVGLAPAAFSAVTVASAPFGVMTADLPAGKSGLSLPLIATDVFSGQVASNSSAAVTFNGSANLATYLNSGDKYYLEITTGPFEGERFDLNTSATISAGSNTATLDLSSSSFSTLNAIGANALANARAVIRPHVTLAKLATAFSPALVGNNNSALADTVWVMSPNGLIYYYLRGDNQTWRESGKTADVRNLVIPPDVSVLVQLRSGAKRWTHAGVVRTNAFRKNFVGGLQGFATGFPIDLSPIQVGAFTDLSHPANVRWVGNDNPAQADAFKIFDSALNDFRSYQLKSDGTTWVLTGDSTNVASTPLLKVQSMLVVSRTNPDSSYVIAPPFSP